jgi:ABC-type transport system substrate-binding protein
MRCKILAATLVFLLGTAAALAPPQAKKKTKTLHAAIPYRFEIGLDPVEQNHINLQSFHNSIYCTLFKLDSQLRPYPFLVEKFQRKGKTVVFHINRNARFSDGSAITAADVARSLEVGMSRKTSANPVYKLIEGGNELFRGKTSHCSGIKILGSKIFEIRFRHENVEFGHYFSIPSMAILPRDRKNIVFSGAFQVTHLEKKKKKTVVTLKQNPWYIGGKSKIHTIYIHFYHAHAVFERAIMKGEPDIFLYSRRFKLPRSRHKYNYFKTPSFGGFYFKLNPVKGPFKDKRLRTFFKLFILAQDFRKSQDWQLAMSTRLVLPYSLTGYSLFKDIEPGDFKKLVPPKKVKVRCVNPDSGIRPTLFPLLKKRLKQYNLDLELRWDGLANINRLERKGEVDLTGIYYLADIPLSSYFYESLFTPGHELNLFGYQVPEALELLEAYRNETGSLKKLKVLSRLEEIAQEEAILIPLVNPLYILGYKNHLKHVSIDKFLDMHLEDIDVEERY